MDKNKFTFAIDKYFRKLGLHEQYASDIPLIIATLSFNELQSFKSDLKNDFNNSMVEHTKELISNLKHLKRSSALRVRKYRKKTNKVNFQVMISPELKKTLEALKMNNSYLTYEKLLEDLVKKEL